MRDGNRDGNAVRPPARLRGEGSGGGELIPVRPTIWAGAHAVAPAPAERLAPPLDAAAVRAA